MSVIASIKVTLEIDAGSTWGLDCSLSQIRKQAMDGGEGKLRKILADNHINIIGKPEVYKITLLD